MGIVLVAFFKARTSSGEEATNTSTLRRTNSSARAGNLSSFTLRRSILIKYILPLNIAEFTQRSPENLAPGAQRGSAPETDEFPNFGYLRLLLRLRRQAKRKEQSA